MRAVIKGVDAAFEPVTYGSVVWGDDDGGITIFPRTGHEAIMQRIRRMSLLTPSGDRIAPEDPRWGLALPFGLSGSRLWAEPEDWPRYWDAAERTFGLRRPPTSTKAWDEAAHPREPGGAPDSTGGRFTEGGGGPAVGDDPRGDRAREARASQTGTPEFQQWFKGSAIADDEGHPIVVYHQTSAEAADAIRREGFRLDRPLARRNDERVPDGVFFKPSSADIGIGRGEPVQVPVFLSIKRPLRISTDDSGAALKALVMAADPEYRALNNQSQAIDREHMAIDDRLHQDLTAAMKEDDRVGPQGTKTDPVFKLMDENIKTWNAKQFVVAAAQRVRVVEYLVARDFDGLILERDKGGFNRVTKTIVALRPDQIRLASPDAVRAYNRSTWGKAA